MKILWIYNLLFLCVFNAPVAQTRVPRHDNAVLIPQSDLIIIGRVQGRKYIADESREGTFEKYEGELVQLVVQEVLLGQVELEDRSSEHSTPAQVYVPGYPFLVTDREIVFLPSETYLVFLRRYTVKEEETPRLVVWNRSLKKWERFPDPSTTYFMVVGGGDGLVPQKERYQDFIQETRRLCYEMRKQR